MIYRGICHNPIRKRCPLVSRQVTRKPFTVRRAKNQVLNVLLNPFNMIVLISLVILISLVAVPLVDVLKTTFTLAKPEARRTGGQIGSMTLYY